MKSRFIALLVLVSFITALLTSAPEKDKSPLLVVLLMVKNEKEVIIPTLQTLLSKKNEPGSMEIAYILYDTGSTDGTDTIAKDFFIEHGIKRYRIAKDEFVDFSTSRNRALNLARKSYPSSTFILFPDAEWYMHNFDDLLDFCRKKSADYNKGETPPAYYRVRMGRPEYMSLTPRLFLTHDSVEFEGVVHECPNKYSGENVPASIYFDIGASRFGTEKSQKRWFRDRELLLKDLEEHPDNPRTALYLGLTESWIKDYENAYKHLKHRLTLPSFAQEDYWAVYNLAEVVETLSYEQPEKFTWREAHDYYLQAFNMRPHRAEPLVRIASYYRDRGNYEISYLYARRAAELPLPSVEEEVLPILTTVYSFERWDILSQVAWYVADYELGERAVKIAIESDPNAVHLYNTLSYYWERKAKA